MENNGLGRAVAETRGFYPTALQTLTWQGLQDPSPRILYQASDPRSSLSTGTSTRVWRVSFRAYDTAFFLGLIERHVGVQHGACSERPPPKLGGSGSTLHRSQLRPEIQSIKRAHDPRAGLLFETGIWAGGRLTRGSTP
jgi:hypothetical protein